MTGKTQIINTCLHVLIVCLMFCPIFFFLLKPGSGPGVNGLDHHVDDIERQKAEPMDTVFVRQVAPSGPADRAGLSTGNALTYRIICFKGRLFLF